MKNIKIKDRLFTSNSEYITITEISNKSGLSEYRLFCDKNIKDVQISFEIPMLGILSTLAPTIEFNRNRMVKQWFSPRRSKSNFYCGIPMLAMPQDGEKNYLTVALSDAIGNNELSVCVNDFVSYDKIKVEIKIERMQAEKSVDLRVDMREVPITQALQDLGKWFEGFYPIKYPVPDAAFDSLYSSWYNFHQHPSAEKLLPELKQAALLGFKTVIIDDGWQYDGNGTGDYIDCGDWAVSKEKFPNFRDFVNKVHSFGIRVMLWFPVPFVGFHTEAYQRFKDKLLYEEKGNTNAGILDPRYACVRRFIVDNLCNFLNENDLDGLKLDFIDSFMEKEETPCANDEMDEKDLSSAIIKLLEEINESLRNIKEDVLIEFRQDYVGPAITRYGNMLRVADCAFDSITNRVAVTDMQMLGYSLAVHSDMLFWSTEEKNENVARQLLHILFSVPQISILLQEYPQEHFEIVKNFIAYYETNKKLLHGGDILVQGADQTYSMVQRRSAEKTIAVLYSKNTYHCTGNTDLFNATSGEEIIIVNDSDEVVKAQNKNCFGKVVETLELPKGVHLVRVAVGGLLELRK